jgi:tellurite resistance protein TerC
MFGGVSGGWWAGFHAVVAAVLVADSLLTGHRRESRPAKIFAWLGTAALVLATAGFACWIAAAQGRQTALEFAAGYIIEASLSVDNLFVFLILFRGFQISRERQHKALLWGIWGAFVLRAIFIGAGITLLRRFEWIPWIFGAFLLYAAWRTLRGGHSWVASVRRPKAGRVPLLWVILTVEAADLLFATDSIPAVLSVTHNPFVAYTSNVAAILALRSLYFALAAMLDRFRYLHYGLGAILAFAALKMLAAPWINVPVTLSLAVIAAILAVCAVASAASQRASKSAGERE